MKRPFQKPTGRAVVPLLVLMLFASACGARFKDTQVAAKSGSSANGGLGGATTANTEAPAPAGDAGAAAAPAGGPAPTDAGAGAPAGGVPAAGGSATPAGGTPAAGGGAPAAPGAVDAGATTGVTATNIKIGYLLPLTGAAPVPSNFDKGANVYWNFVNKQGGINGRKVDIVIEDTQSSASVGKDKAKKLIENDKVFAIIVLDRLENQQAIGAYLDARKVPNVEIQTPANLPGSQTWTFGVTIDHAVQGKLVADYFAKVLKAKKIAIVYENTPALSPGRDAFKKEAAAVGATVAYEKAIDGQANDFSNEALGLSRSGATAAWLYMAPTPAAKLANTADAAGYHPTWFANSISWGFDLVFKVAPKALAGARAFSPWLPLTDPRTNTYQTAYRDQYGQAPDDLGLVGWGVGQIAAEGMRRAGKALGQNSFRVAMQALNFRPDLWAPLSFGPTTREGANVVAVLKEAGGRWALERDFTASF
jgi:branched-chain amino acid transport system substrate-binding protein